MCKEIRDSGESTQILLTVNHVVSYKEKRNESEDKEVERKFLYENRIAIHFELLYTFVKVQLQFF